MLLDDDYNRGRAAAERLADSWRTRVKRESASRPSQSPRGSSSAEDAIRAGARLHEVHPEVSFAAIAGAPLDWAKLSYRGAITRRALLDRVGIHLPDDLGDANHVPTDDVLDAAAAAWSAARIAVGSHERLPEPPEVFSDGLPSAINV